MTYPRLPPPSLEDWRCLPSSFWWPEGPSSTGEPLDAARRCKGNRGVNIQVNHRSKQGIPQVTASKCTGKKNESHLNYYRWLYSKSDWLKRANATAIGEPRCIWLFSDVVKSHSLNSNLFIQNFLQQSTVLGLDKQTRIVPSYLLQASHNAISMWSVCESTEPS